MDFKANCGIWGTMFGVPCIVADNFLKLATGEQLKVLLYILRCSGRACTDEEIAASTGVSVDEAADAVMFWQQVNVLTSASGQTVIMKQPVENNINAPSPSTTQNVTEKAVTGKKQNLSPSEISRIMQDSNDISELFKVAESALGTLNHTQQNSLIWMYNYLGLKKEVIITLLFYCVKIEKINSAYIEKIACSWAENDINNLAAAEDEIQRMTEAHSFTGQIMKVFEMNRRPTTKQADFIAKWKEAGFSLELISYAYEKTIEQINKLSFEYINKILLSWKNNGLATVREVRHSEEDYKKNKKNTSGFAAAVNSDVEKYNVVINKF